uniref:Uncharacterized protein n=1 Tax=Tanacetum cinerariifolium TaxID=118510 RepID=A0A6L2P7A4_TANCI|nr:hypothetical protein [Tanacetum cinerariifolium]
MMLPKVIVNYKDGVRKRSVWFQPVRERDVWFQPRSVRRLGVLIAELRDLKDWGDGDVTLGLMKRLRLDNMEKAVCLRLMMKETKVKIFEKNISIRRLRRNEAVSGSVLIVELRDLKNWGDGDVTLGLMKRLRLDNMEKAVCLRLMMKETKVKISEKNISIRRLRRNGAVGVNLLLEAAVKYVGVCGFLASVDMSMSQRWFWIMIFFDKGHMVLVDFGFVCFGIQKVAQRPRKKRSVGVGFCFKMPNVLNRFPLVLKDLLLTVLNEEVARDVAVVREYRGVAYGLRIGIWKREESIKELKALGDREGIDKTVRFMEGLQADDMDSCNRTLSLMREVEVKAREKSRFILKLSALLISDELHRSVSSSEWKPQFIRRCNREISNDVRLGTEINALCARLNVIVDERVNFVDELDMLAQEFVPVKMAEFMKQIQDKDIRNLMTLQILGREFELRAREKEIFIQKLKGNMNF